MGVGKLLGPSLSVGNLEVVGFVGNLTGRVFLVGKLTFSPSHMQNFCSSPLQSRLQGTNRQCFVYSTNRTSSFLHAMPKSVLLTSSPIRTASAHKPTSCLGNVWCNREWVDTSGEVKRSREFPNSQIPRELFTKRLALPSGFPCPL